MDIREIHNITREIGTIGHATREWLITDQNCPLLSTYGFGLAGWSRAREGFFFARPVPDFGQMLACLGGHGEVLVDGVWKPCGPGMVYLTSPGIRSAYRALSGETWRLSWVHDRQMEPPFVAPRLISADVETLDAVIRGLYTEVMGTREPEVMEDWLRLLRTQTRRISRPATPPPRLLTLWNAVVADPAHAWTTAELANRAGMSEEHLRRLSWAETGRSPMKQVTYLRMRHAEALLVSGRYPIAEVATRVGYDNPFAFSTAFKREMGHPPSASRQNLNST